MRIEFEFEAPAEGLMPSEGVAVLSCIDEDGEQFLLYGTYGAPSSLVAVGMYTVALRNAQQEFDEDED